jgi:hypothetical protein
MSGQLVGEVIAASAELRKRGLSRRGYEALIGIAEKSHAVTRQGSVRRSWIRDAIYGAVSLRAADRAIRELKRLELIEVIKRGYKPPKGKAVAPIYEIAELSTPISVDSIAELSTPISVDSSEAFDTSGEAFDTFEKAFDTYPHPTCGDPTIDVSIDGSIDGGGARVSDEPPNLRVVPDPRNDPPPPNPNQQPPATATNTGLSPPEQKRPEDEPDSPYCPRHRPEGTDQPCFACKQQRERFESTHPDNPKDTPNVITDEDRANAALKRDCPKCEGYSIGDGISGIRPCRPDNPIPGCPVFKAVS